MNTFVRTAPTHWCHIFLAGDINVAKQVIREECMKNGLCVTIEPLDFIYTGGEESGYRVGLINYPKFPQSHREIDLRAHALASLLLARTHQLHALIVTPEQTQWIGRENSP